MDKKEICILLEQGIIYATNTLRRCQLMLDDFKHHHMPISRIAEHQETMQHIENYIHRCQQIINDNSSNDE
mgnify:CR=1 FL=1